MLTLIEHAVFAVVVILLVKAWVNQGPSGALTLVGRVILSLPGLRSVVRWFLAKEVKSFTSQIKAKTEEKRTKEEKQQKTTTVHIPKQGLTPAELMTKMEQLRALNQTAGDGRMFAYVYTGEGENFELQKRAFDLFSEKTGLSLEHDQLVRFFHEAFMHENALNPTVFPALRRFETEVVGMTSSMLHGDCHVVGSMTSGGTESLLMAVKTYRDQARDLRPHVRHPEMVAPLTIHPAHEKAAHYFGVKIVHVQVGDDGRPDVTAYEKAISSNTIALLCSAPQYCHGTIDPVLEISAVAVRHRLPLHVDACFGGFMLPWLEKLGYPVPVFDFRLDGVTSISADIHKYGFGCKGASVILYRDDSIRKYQMFAYSGWPGGLFGSPSMAGTRPGGNIAAAWAALMAMGEEGYLRVAKQLMSVTDTLKTGINAIPGICVVGRPHMTAFAVKADDPEVDIYAVADVMESKGWTMERQQLPPSLHFSIMPHHTDQVVGKLLEDFRTSVETAKGNVKLSGTGSAAMYGMMAKIPEKGIVDGFIIEFFSQLYKL